MLQRKGERVQRDEMTLHSVYISRTFFFVVIHPFSNTQSHEGAEDNECSSGSLHVVKRVGNGVTVASKAALWTQMRMSDPKM